jgi:hypothetical protein
MTPSGCNRAFGMKKTKPMGDSDTSELTGRSPASVDPKDFRQI